MNPRTCDTLSNQLKSNKTMFKLLKTKIGRLRIMGFLEGSSLLFLVFVAVPLKYGCNLESLTKMMGPIHGVLFYIHLHC